jgi:ADP-ribose pyrophosphatase YjhB (NUDIX family)
VTSQDLDRGPDARSTDLASGGGMPAWLAAALNHCANCGGALEMAVIPTEERPRLACVACGHIAYVNPRLVVTTIPVTDDGDVVLLQRGFEPGRGSWAQPGGFLEIDETPTEGAVRETLEETGLVVAPGEIVGLYARLEAAVVVLVYEAKIIGGSMHTSPEALDVRPFTPEAIPWQDIAFKTTWWALVDWLGKRRPDLPAPSWNRWESDSG